MLLMTSSGRERRAGSDLLHSSGGLYIARDGKTQGQARFLASAGGEKKAAAQRKHGHDLIYLYQSFAPFTYCGAAAPPFLSFLLVLCVRIFFRFDCGNLAMAYIYIYILLVDNFKRVFCVVVCILVLIFCCAPHVQYTTFLIFVY